MRAVILAWAALLGLLAGELGFVAIGWDGLQLPLFAVAITMAGIAVAMFMRVAKAPPIARAFAAAGLLWTLILLGMGTMDPLTRTDYPTTVSRTP